jgi:hypothetical protein
VPFSETIRERVKTKANFTCCWCQDIRNKVDVHHIIPEAQGGPNEEDNAAPLCGSCHDLLGNNPDLRKEIRQRRDQWYEICWRVANPQYGWPIGLDVPILNFSQELPPIPNAIPTKGLQLTDKQANNANDPPLLYLSVYFKDSRYFAPYALGRREKWLYLDAHMRFAFSLRIQVSVGNDWEVEEFMGILRNSERKFAGGKRDAWSLTGPPPENSKSMTGDYLLVSRTNAENRLVMTTFTPTVAAISIHARFSENVATALGDYLEDVGFAKSFSSR